ncbi:MAG: TonB-dependent receptor [Janthinobacterium lividum]
MINSAHDVISSRHLPAPRVESPLQPKLSVNGRKRAGLFEGVALLAVGASLGASPALAAEPGPAKKTQSEAVSVVGHRHGKNLMKAPVSVTEFNAATIRDLNIEKFSDYALKTPGLAFSYGSGGAPGIAESRTIAIRGVSGANTTGLYIDNTPVPNSIDPRIVDLESIEVLKSPQGTLYGATSLSGDVRLITAPASLIKDSTKYTVQAGATSHGGSPDGGASVINNSVLLPGILAAHTMLFYNHDAGFLTRTYPDQANSTVRDAVGNQGAITSFGGSESLRYEVNDRLSLVFKFLLQKQEDYGYPVAYAPLPTFLPKTYTSDRAANVQEKVSDLIYLPALDFLYNGPGYHVTSSTSYFARIAKDTEDGTEASTGEIAAATGYSYTGPVIWRDRNSFTRWSQEDRVAFDPLYGFFGSAGIYLAHTSSVTAFPPVMVPGLAAASGDVTNLYYQGRTTLQQDDAALFSEINYKPLQHTTITAGGRVYYLRQVLRSSSSGQLVGSNAFSGTNNSPIGFLPKFSVSQDVAPNALVYASASRGFRPGGVGGDLPSSCDADLAAIGRAPGSTARYNSDTIWNYEIGTKLSAAQNRLTFTGALFDIEWNGIQQSAYLPTCGFAFTTNVGHARNRGGEAEVTLKPLPQLALHAGASYNDASITKSGPNGLGQPVGSRIDEVPKFTVTASMQYSMRITSGVTGFISLDDSYIGNSLSALSTPSEALTRPAYNIANARIGARWDRNELTLYVNNFLNEKANLGDVLPISFEQTETLGNGSVVPLTRVALLHPLQVGFILRHGF